MKMEVEKVVIVDVTAEDIAKGERCSRCKCPIALALTRAGWENVYVHGNSVTQGFFKTRPWEKSGWLPNVARDFIVRFDDQKPVEPFSFELKYRVEEP